MNPSVSIQKTIFILIVALQLSPRLFSQYDDPVLLGNNGTNNIVFANCNSLTNLNFNSGYPALFISGKYTWTLYLNGNQIDQSEQLLLCDPSCNSTCPLPYASFNESPQSGDYKVRIQIKKYFCIGDPCGDGLWVPLSDALDKYSNIINVSRPDDGFICKCETPVDYSVDCDIMSTIHQMGFPFDVRAKHSITIDCTLPNQTITNLTAGDEINIVSPFSAESGSDFSAVIDPCDFAGRLANPNSSDSIQELQTEYQTNSSVLQNTNQSDKMDSSANKEVIIFPNPSSTSITINIPSTQNSPKGQAEPTIEIYNAEGILVYEKKNLSSENLIVDVSQFATGPYLVRITDADKTYMKKFIRE